MKTIESAAAIAAFLCLSLAPARAQVAFTGSFTATQSCEAVRSIRSGDNPGDVKLEIGKTYRVVGKNKPEATHYLIEAPGAEPLRRWTAAGCGRLDDVAEGSGAGAPIQGPGAPGGGRSAFYLLAVSWQPAFCEEHRDKKECRTQSQDRFDATHFTLHGLWPEPRDNVYCNVPEAQRSLDEANRWDELPEPQMSDATRARLDEVMPGTQSQLQRHEWIKHGVCFGAGPEEYFGRAVSLMNELNASKTQQLFAAHIGSELATADIKAALDSDFGPGAGDRLRVSCKREGGRRLIVEMTLGLVGEIGDHPSLGALIGAARPTDPGCPSGFVDAVAR